MTAGGEFITQGVPPGQYVPRLPNQFSIRAGNFESATLDGKDLTTTPITLESQSVSGILINFTDRRTELTGRVLDASGKADPNATVIVFPADYQAWIRNGMHASAARAVPTSQLGTYCGPTQALASTWPPQSARNWAGVGSSRRWLKRSHRVRRGDAGARRDQAPGPQDERCSLTSCSSLRSSPDGANSRLVQPNSPIVTASIAGTIVTDEQNSRPLSRAVVTLSGAALRPSLVAITDDAGRFAFSGLPGRERHADRVEAALPDDRLRPDGARARCGCADCGRRRGSKSPTS